MKKANIIWLFLFLFTLCACSSVTTSSDSKPSVDNTDESISESGTENTTEPEEIISEDIIYAVGDTGTLGNWDISVTDVSFTDRFDVGDGILYYSPDEGNQYMIVSTGITNTGKEAATFLPMISTYKDVTAKVYYDEEYEYSATQFIGVSGDLHQSTMNPLTSKEGIIAFPLPNIVTESEESLVIVFSMGSESITYTLR